MIIQGEQNVLAEKAAWLIYKEGIEKLLQEQDQVVIAVPGGRSVSEVFRVLSSYEVEWSRVHIFMLDERLVPLDHKESNYRLLHERLGHVVSPTTLHPFVYRKDEQTSFESYNNELQKYGGKFDIILASSGEDGHIGSLFPDHKTMEYTPAGFFQVDDSPKPPPQRMAASAQLIRNSGMGLLLVMGESKKSALDRLLNPEVAERSCPAKLISTLAHHYILTDLEVNLP